MLEIERQVCRQYYDALIAKGRPPDSSLWTVIDCATIMISLHQGLWIRCDQMAEDLGEELPDKVLEVDWQNSDPRCLAWIYSDLMSAETKEKTAAIYTPEPIVKYMVRSSLLLSIKDSCGIDVGEIPPDPGECRSALRSLSRLTILDPCVGCGLFLYEAWIQMCGLEDALTISLDPARLKEKRVIRLSQLHGVDINPAAIEISKRLLQFAWRLTRR